MPPKNYKSKSHSPESRAFGSSPFTNRVQRMRIHQPIAKVDGENRPRFARLQWIKQMTWSHRKRLFTTTAIMVLAGASAFGLFALYRQEPDVKSEVKPLDVKTQTPTPPTDSCTSDELLARKQEASLKSAGRISNKIPVRSQVKMDDTIIVQYFYFHDKQTGIDGMDRYPIDASNACLHSLKAVANRTHDYYYINATCARANDATCPREAALRHWGFRE
jgi:hypothetical protein